MTANPAIDLSTQQLRRWVPVVLRTSAPGHCERYTDDVNRRKHEKMIRDIHLYNLISGFEMFLQKFADMLNARANAIGSFKEKFTQVLLENIFHISHDILKLAASYQVEVQKGKLENIAAMEILSRQLMELYCVYFYLFVENEEKEVRALRWHVYQLYGKNHALKMTKEWVPPKDDDNDSIEEILNWIKANKVYQNQPPDIQKRCLKPNSATLKPLGKIAESFGIPGRLFDYYYSHFSCTVHSNFLFLIAHGDPRIEPVNKRLKKTFMWANLFTNMAIMDLIKSSESLSKLWEPDIKESFETSLTSTKEFLLTLEMEL